MKSARIKRSTHLWWPIERHGPAWEPLYLRTWAAMPPIRRDARQVRNNLWAEVWTL